jgi:diacylglycerol kinase family enzyme
MERSMEIGVITNPNSRKNRGRPNRAAELQSIVGNLGEVHETSDVDSIKPILREFLRKRARYWVADGGDGALHWMLRTGLEVLEEKEFSGGNYQLPLTMPTNGGTIDFVAGNVGIKGTAEKLLSALRRSLESGTHVEEVEVDSMLIKGTEVTENGDEPFRTYGFAVAAAGVGQRFFSKYYEEEDPNPKTILKVIVNTLASMPVAMSPLRVVPGLPVNLRKYARDMLEPAVARVSIDGMTLPDTHFRGVHIASMSINLGNVFRFFSEADQEGRLHCTVGTISPLGIIRNLPRMHLGKQLKSPDAIDRACRGMTIEAIGDELLAPVIDGEYYRNLREIRFQVGPRVRIPKVVSDHRA